MSDAFFWELLGLKPGADRDSVRRSYHSLAKRNHPDLWPDEQKGIQEIKMMALNEAYKFLSRLPEENEPAHGRTEVPRTETNADPATVRSVGFHKDPAYAYYKQGFVSFSRAVHGIEALYRSLTRPKPKSYKPRDETYKRFSQSLAYLKKAGSCFHRVVREHPESVWKRDSTWKIHQIERFNSLYRKILSNLQQR